MVCRRSVSPRRSLRKTYPVPDVIANTSPVQYLYQANLLDILPALYNSIPKAKQSGYLSSVAPILDRLDALRFRLDPITRVAVLKLAGETA